MKTHISSTAACITALIGALPVATADIPKSSQHALQNRAAEKLEIEAKIVRVESSKTGLKTGETVLLRYWVQNPKKMTSSTSEPIELVKGKKYRAYLGPPSDACKHLADKSRGIYFPQAASGSFVLVPNSKLKSGK